MAKQFDAGKLSVEDLTAKLGIYQQTEKRAKLIITAKALDLKYGITKGISNQLIGNEKIKSIKSIQDRTANRGH
jgi:hypothetical protein